MKLLPMLAGFLVAVLVLQLVVLPLVRWWRQRWASARLQREAADQELVARLRRERMRAFDRALEADPPEVRAVGRADETFGGVQSVVPGKKVLG